MINCERRDATKRFQMLRALGWKFDKGHAQREQAVFEDWDTCSETAFNILSGAGDLKVQLLERAGWKYDDTECVWRQKTSQGDSVWYHPVTLSFKALQKELERDIS